MKYEEEAIQFYENVNAELKRQRKTQVEMCENIGIPLASFRVKISNHNVINIFDGLKIARFLGVSVGYLVDGVDCAPDSGEIEKLKDKIKRIETICKE